MPYPIFDFADKVKPSLCLVPPLHLPIRHDSFIWELMITEGNKQKAEPFPALPFAL
jgi:hypothetical protein